MEFKSIKIAGQPVMAIFCGDKYVFYNDWAGVIAAAYRDPARRYDEPQYFVLQVGNEHCQGGSLTDSTVVRACKTYITKNENLHVKRKVEYEIKETKLQHRALMLQVV